MTTPNPLFTIDTLPATSQAAIRAFDDRYLASIGAVPPSTWTDIGEAIPVDSPMTTFPLSTFAIAYQQTMGEARFRKLSEKSFDVRVQEFDAGYEGSLLDITKKIFAYRQWLQGPARLQMAEGRHRNKQIARLLEAGESTYWGGTSAATSIDGVYFFSASHLCDPTDPASTTWSNYQSSAKTVVSISNLEAEVTAMQAALDENGDEIGVSPDTILVPTATYEPLKNLLAQSLILQNGTGSAGVTNPYMGKFDVVRVPELTDANDWYLVDSKLVASSGLPPWMSLKMSTSQSLALRYYDEASDFFKDTGKIKASSHIWYGFSLGFPHAIRKIKGA